MVLTRAQQQAALKHILESILNLQVDSPVHKALTFNAIDSPHDLVSLREVDFELLD